MSNTLYDLIDYAIKYHASDIHIATKKVPSFRIHGKIVFTPEFSIIEKNEMDRFLQILDVNHEVYHAVSAYDTAYEYKERRLRVHAYKHMYGDAISLRLISQSIPSIKDAFLPPVVETFTKFPSGLVLVTGATGSGKSTTLASLIEKINKEEAKRIITVEDPIEFVYVDKKSTIIQREVPRSARSFSDALRESLREDPDIALIGELRDLETIQNAVRLAETGHLVFSTLHTRNTPETIDRIIDIFPGNQQHQIRYQLSSVLQAVISQQLLPRKGGGRVPLCEVMVMTDALRGMIRENAPLNSMRDSIMSSRKANNSQTFDQALSSLVKDGLVEVAVAKNYFSGNDSQFRELILS